MSGTYDDELFYKRMGESEEEDYVGEPSPYILKANAKLEKSAKTGGICVDAEKYRRSGSAGNASYVLDALYKYPYLDRVSLESCLAGGHMPAIEPRKVWEALKTLRDFGIIDVWHYDNFCFYSLTAAARAQMGSNKKFKTVVPGYDASVPEILGIAGLCRWHAHAVSATSVGLNIVRQTVKVAGQDYLADSYIEFTRAVRYRLFAYPIPRDGNFAALKDKILDSWSIQKNSIQKGQASLTVLVSPTLSDAIACNRLFSVLSETAGKTIYYALDSRKGPMVRGLRGIYKFEEGKLRSIGIE